MIISLFAWLVACDGGSKDDSSGGANPGTDDSATDDSGTSKKDDSGDDSGTGGDDSGTGGDDSGTGCTKLEWFQDLDHDGYGAGAATLDCKSPGTDWITQLGDCDDSLVEVNPAATEICNKIDDDCDEAIDDEDDTVVGITWYPDADGDGYGDFTGASIQSCAGAGGYAPDDGKHPADCDDADGTVYPGAPELCDDMPQGCVAKDWKGDAGVATFYPASGGAEDWTADLAAGTYGAPAEVDISDDGELVICDGVWYAALTVKMPALNVTVTGLHGSAVTTLSGGDEDAPFRVAVSSADVTAQGLTITEGDACYGAAVSTAIPSSCSKSGGGASYTLYTTLTLRDVRVVDNEPSLWLALAAVYMTNGQLYMEDTTIANNNVQGLYGTGQGVFCSGSTKNDAGIWGNTSGVYLETYGTMPLIFESDGCDFDGTGGTYTPSYDVSLWGKMGEGVYDFGDDAVFLCDVSSGSCVK
jgi:hypothetical protein